MKILKSIGIGILKFIIGAMFMGIAITLLFLPYFISESIDIEFIQFFWLYIMGLVTAYYAGHCIYELWKLKRKKS